ncbi:MAG: hypothetical protein ACRC80_02550, partial [Waterburya sp.]
PYDTKGAFNIKGLSGVAKENALAGIAGQVVQKASGELNAKVDRAYTSFDKAIDSIFDNIVNTLTKERKSGISQKLAELLENSDLTFLGKSLAKLKPLFDLSLKGITTFGNGLGLVKDKVLLSASYLGKAINSTLVISGSLVKNLGLSALSLQDKLIFNTAKSGLNLGKNLLGATTSISGSLFNSAIHRPIGAIQGFFNIGKKASSYDDPELDRLIRELREKRKRIANFDKSIDSTILFALLIEKLEKLDDNIEEKIKALDAVLAADANVSDIRKLEKEIKNKKKIRNQLIKDIRAETPSNESQNEAKAPTAKKASNTIFNQITGLTAAIATSAGIALNADSAEANPLLNSVSGIGEFFKSFSGNFDLSSLTELSSLALDTIGNLSSAVDIPFIGVLAGGLTGVNTLLGVTSGLLSGFKNNSGLKPLIGQAFDFASSLLENTSNLTIFGLRLGGLAQIATTLGVVGLVFTKFGTNLKNAINLAGQFTNTIKTIERIRGASSEKDIALILQTTKEKGLSSLTGLETFKEFS